MCNHYYFIWNSIDDWVERWVESVDFHSSIFDYVYYVLCCNSMLSIANCMFNDFFTMDAPGNGYKNVHLCNILCDGNGSQQQEIFLIFFIWIFIFRSTMENGRQNYLQTCCICITIIMNMLQIQCFFQSSSSSSSSSWSSGDCCFHFFLHTKSVSGFLRFFFPLHFVLKFRLFMIRSCSLCIKIKSQQKKNGFVLLCYVSPFCFIFW